MNIIRIIEKKRNGGHLTKKEIQWIIENYVKDLIPDYQISALLMAIYFQGLELEELVPLTESMIHTGESIDLSSIPGVKVDKHSTGGVGDKVSLILAPLVASAGVPVPMMSGHGLGHTGGTLDKLEAIPGFRTNLTVKEFKNEIEKIGFAMMGQTVNIAPADKKLYGLRDVTGTIPSIPLISSSIISKKKAEGAEALVLDVKTGKGAFFPNKNETLHLARALANLGNRLSIKTEALLTSMDQPLGRTVGNWIETREAIDSLQGKGPSDLMEVVMALGSVMLVLGGITQSYRDAIKLLNKHLESGDPYNRFKEMVHMQHGDIRVIENPELYPTSGSEVVVESPTSGYIQELNALKIGYLVMDMGAGRAKKEDLIDPGAGIVFHRKVGDSVKTGEPLATLLTNKTDEIESFIKRLLKAYTFSEIEVKKGDIVKALIRSDKEEPFFDLP